MLSALLVMSFLSAFAIASIGEARDLEGSFVPGLRSVFVIGAIRRRLDDIPLAIEPAAPCVASSGVAGIASRLDHRFP